MHLFITPHPPIILPEIGQGEAAKAAATIVGMKKIAADIAAIRPKTIALITPHGYAFSDALCVSVGATLQGDFKQFGYPALSYNFAGSPKATAFCEALEESNIQTVPLDKVSARQYKISTQIDHGALVPLHFVLESYSTFELLHIGMGFLSKEQTVQAGSILSNLLDENDVIIASGDLSHRLTKNAPADFDAQGAVYDQRIVDAVKNKCYINILDIPEDLLERAGQCAQRPLEMLLGAIDGYDTKTQVYSYEGPYGVGYMTASIVRGEKSEHSLLSQYLKKQVEKVEQTRKAEDEYVALARQTIETYIRSGSIIPPPKGLKSTLYTEKNGVFVSIKSGGDLRGCIGTIEPVQSCIAEEIIRNAISAASRDPRFSPVSPSELPLLEISVDVLFPPEDIDGPEALDPVEYGVIVSKGYRRGLLLPNLEGIDSAKTQVSIALQKAGIAPSERYAMQRFKVVRHK